MRMQEIDFEARPPIDAYGGGGFRVGGERREGSLLLLPSGVHAWPVIAPGMIDAAAAAPLLDPGADIDLVLFGMGPEIAFLPRAVRESLEAAGIGVEAMSTASACRTFNVLLAEDRRVAGALIAV